MPRLVGKRSNHGFFWSLAVLLVAVAGLGAVEYKGYTDFVPEFGEPRQPVVGTAEDS
ncbi:MAG TPA: hypothetical protein VLS96_06750 [Nodosilinea sp.]|nr:hypothetical protein [Nodosilinea sp.]